MKKKPKIKTKFSDKITWHFCSNCGHANYGVTTVDIKGWPEPVRVPSPVKRTK